MTDGTAPNTPINLYRGNNPRRYRDCFSRIAELSKSVLQAQLDGIKPSSWTTQEWPMLDTQLRIVVLELLSDEQREKLLSSLSDKYFDLDQDKLRQQISDLLEHVATIEDLVSDRINTYKAAPRAEPELNEWIERITDFCNGYIERFNRLAHTFQGTETEHFPWLTPIRLPVKQVSLETNFL